MDILNNYHVINMKASVWVSELTFYYWVVRDAAASSECEKVCRTVR